MSEERIKYAGETRIAGRLAMATDAQLRLFQALKAHIFELEIERDVASNRDREALDRRIEAARQLLEWLAEAVGPPGSPTVQTPRAPES
jgi:hypothetical protein